MPFTASTPWPSLVLCALLAGAGACTCGDPSLLVTVEIAPRAVTTRCVVVAAQAPGIPEDRTGPMLRPPDGGTLAVAVYRDDLPESISVVARGFDDPSCTILNEEAPPRTATFVRGQVVPVPLQLNGSLCLDAGTGTACPGGGKVCRSDHFCVDAGTELDCLDGDDDDGDGRIDCLDVDCLAAACADGCFLSPVCQADGGCRGPPTSCDMPPGLCFQPTGTCSSPGGTCSYAGDTTRGCDDSTACTFNDRCTAAGGCAGTPYTCPPTECSAGSCLGDGGCALVATRAGQPCFGGVCTDAGTCLTFPYPPSNFNPVAIADGGVAGPIVIACSATYNSTDGGLSWCSGQPAPVARAISQPGGPAAVVLAMSGLDITSTGSLTLVGSRPVILAVYGDATISGTLSARSATNQPAGAGADPGGGLCTAGNGASTSAGDVGSGGGGGGHALDGGRGGGLTGTGGVAGGGAGAATGAAQVVPLRGGCRGGEGGRPNDTGMTGGRGGRGGGAVQLSTAGSLTISGIVTASGGGGQGGRRDQVCCFGAGGNGGGGGGSGGAVLLEGEDVSVATATRLTANGGGGGEGGDQDSVFGNDGDPGLDGPIDTDMGGTGGRNGVSCSGDGAEGGSATGPAGNGVSVTYSSGGCAAGGAGGAAGRIRVNGHRSCQAGAGVVSPAATFGGTCP